MGLLSRLLEPQADERLSPIDDYWYGPVGGASVAGVNVTPEIAMRQAVVFCLCPGRVGKFGRIAADYLPERA